MSAIFPVFHVSQLKKCLRVPEERVETWNIKLASDLVYEEKLVKILDSKERETRSKTIKLYKVLWSNHDETDATWETKAYLKEVYSNFL
jgi:RNA polymerase-interacting CarD/CdnL/TRCF family regulator